VDGVGDQRQRVGGIAEGQFGDDEGRVERCADREGRVKALRHVAMTVMIVPVAVVVMMVIVRHSADNRRLQRELRRRRL